MKLGGWVMEGKNAEDCVYVSYHDDCMATCAFRTLEGAKAWSGRDWNHLPEDDEDYERWIGVDDACGCSVAILRLPLN